jgi:hypothetical protein
MADRWTFGAEQENNPQDWAFIEPVTGSIQIRLV